MTQPDVVQQAYEITLNLAQGFLQTETLEASPILRQWHDDYELHVQRQVVVIPTTKRQIVVIWPTHYMGPNKTQVMLAFLRGEREGVVRQAYKRRSSPPFAEIAGEDDAR